MYKYMILLDTILTTQVVTSPDVDDLQFIEYTFSEYHQPIIQSELGGIADSWLRGSASAICVENIRVLDQKNATPGTEDAHTKHPVTAVVISWEGMHAAAQTIAEGLAGNVDSLFVIYSNDLDESEDGPGIWHQVPQRWYFGRKFAAALDATPEDATLLVVSADASADDWPDLVAGLRAAQKADPSIAVWAPDLDRTPWPSNIVAEEAEDDNGLLGVVQTDGVVWALAPDIVARLRDLDFSSNNLGWGIDWAASAIAHLAGRRVVRDVQRRVRHAEGRGYSTAVATQQFKNLLEQLSPEERDWILETHGRVISLQGIANGPVPEFELVQVEEAAPSPVIADGETEATSQQIVAAAQALEAPLDAVKAVYLVDGAAWVLASGPLLGRDVAIEAGGHVVPLTPVSAPPRIAGVSLPYPMEDIEDRAWRQKLNGHGDWQVQSWNTLCITVWDRGAARRIPVGRALSVSGVGPGGVFEARLATHRAVGNFVVLLKHQDGSLVSEITVPLDPRAVGRNSPENYQKVSLPLPDSEDVHAIEIYIDFSRSTDPEGDPPAVFLAQPNIAPKQYKEFTVWQARHTVWGSTKTPHWHRADVLIRAYDNPEPITLLTSSERRHIALVEPAHVTLKHDWGHVLELQASRSFSGVLLRNGVPEFPVHLAAGHSILRLPISFLTGTTTEVEIRDASGIQRVWRDWLLPPRQLTSVDHLQTEACAPVPVELFPQLGYRYAALRAHCSGGSSPSTVAQLDTVIGRLEGGPERCVLGPLAFPEVDTPEVSVVIPAHGKVRTTFYCLNALLLAWNCASFEVILVDDASPDETSRIEEFVSGIRVVRNEAPQRFIRACNAGVAAARGRYVVLLNNDTEPTTGWLDALIDRFERDPTTGLAGSRLLYPDGRLQEAGGIVWGSGDPWNYGRLGNPNDPRFTYARQVDYVSGAALMTTRELWDTVGGLSDYLEPMYFEDTDLAFKIRAAGSTVWYVPGSTVYHFEGVTSGTDARSGFKRYQEINRPKFKRRWVHDYAAHGTYGHAPDLEKDRNILGRILFIDYTTPTPDRDAGSYAAVREIELMQSLGFKVTLLPENLAWLGGYTKELQDRGVEVITAPFYDSVEAFLEARAHEFDAFYIMRYHVVNKVVPKIRELCPAARIVMNGADLHYLRILRKGLAERDSNRVAEARGLRVVEFEAMRSVDVVVSYNDVEMAVIEAMSEGEVRALKCPWVLDLPKVVTPRAGRAGLSFLGGFQHHPNVEGLRWFVDQVMEPLNDVCPGLELSIYGSRMGEEVRALESSTVRPIGYVEEVKYAYDPHLVFVAPLLSGAGIKGKVLNALARGVPCVLSPLAAEGIGLRHGHDCLIAETPGNWVEAIRKLVEDEGFWTQVRDNALSLAREHFSFDVGREQMRRVFEAVELYGRAET